VLLVTNTLVNSANSILISDVTNGWQGIVISTILITIFGEILPQALCAKHSLWIGSIVAAPMKLVMML